MSNEQGIEAYDSAYPGSMSQRKDGSFIRREDANSLANALLALIKSGDQAAQDLKDALDLEKRESTNRIAELEAKLADWERRSESCESKLGQLEANEQVIELEAKVRELEAERDELDVDATHLIHERDFAEEIGTKLADAVGEHFRVEVGEHSSANDPRDMALAILDGEYVTDSDTDRELAASQQQVERMVEALKIALSAMMEADRHFSETDEKCLSLVHAIPKAIDALGKVVSTEALVAVEKG